MYQEDYMQENDHPGIPIVGHYLDFDDNGDWAVLASLQKKD